MINQPKNLDHPLYTLIDDNLIIGDLKIIAMDLKVSQNVVSQVKCGKVRSARIWKRIIETALKRKKDQERIIKELAA
jgi:hypothetical protein